MITREIKLIISFHTTSEAMHMEKVCEENEINGRLIPLPKEISSSCGLAWCTFLKNRNQIEEVLSKFHIIYQGIYECLI